MRLKKTTEQISTNIDPRLQRIIEQSQREVDTRTFETDAESKVSVIAKVKDVEAWSALAGVHQTNDISIAPDKSGRIVTSKVSVNELENIRQSPGVLSLKATRPVKPLLNKTTEEIEAGSDFLPPGTAKEHGGEGIVVGLVDYGCDFVHQNFRNQDNSTRILALWDQGDEKVTGSSDQNGRVFTRDEINDALNSPQPYEALGYPESGPFPSNPPTPNGYVHGTHVMDIAAGNGSGTGIPGVAPNADLVFVELGSDIPRGVEDVVNSMFGDSKKLLDAVKFIFDAAGESPCVINLSLGTNGGPHDGTTLVEQAIDGLLIEKPNRAIVIAAANSYNDGIHAEGTVRQGDSVDLHWQVENGDFTFNELEVWYNGEDEFAVEIITPDGDSVGKIQLGENGVLDDKGETLVFVANRKSDSTNGDNEIGVFLERGLPTGTWIIRLHGTKVNHGVFHAWIERDHPDFQSSFAPPHDNTHTLGSISCGHKSIVVGSYDAHVPNAPLSSFSSAGPTRDGRQKPEISAPGHKVIAAASGTLNGTTQKSGTSMAAPAVTGVIALMLAEAQANDISLTIDQIRDIIAQAARRNPPADEGWDDRYGLGRIDASKVIKVVKEMVPVSPS
ncbi:S8 family peptidase [Peribacillus sp. NJ11]|uniref:S8 family peptidase n=1 Tax=Peribacillus sp. NJ11 TaxID=3055861 RepID=UPI0025A2354D|nr:S8 family peptidase [Peribacillus sp. NJ11]MDM5223536.1 S8 family peptidase [Peribacillus sp. NJ11]